MAYNQGQQDECSPQLRLLLHQKDQLKNTDRKAGELAVIYQKIIQLAKEERNGPIYFRTMYSMLFFHQQFGDPFKGAQYGEIFLRDGQELMDEMMATTSNPHTMQRNYLFTMSALGELYIEYYQVNAQKLADFFVLYWDAVRKIGYEVYYWQCRLQAALQNNDLPDATQCLARFEGLRKQSVGCYICDSMLVQKYHLLAGNAAAAIEIAEDFIADRVAPENRRKFPQCENSNAHSQYRHLFEYAGTTNQAAFVAQIAPRYYEVAHKDKTDTPSALLLRALYRDFTDQEFAAECVIQLLSKKATPWVKMQNGMCQSIYFELLHQSGIKTIALKAKSALPIPALEEELYSTNELASYCQTQADKIGAAFDESRPGFDYPKRRKTYRDLLNVKLTALHHEKR